jgi:hypothetical protein
MTPRNAHYDRFDAKTKRVGDCLIWTGAKNSDGYGVTRGFYQELVLAHRFVHELYGGPIPAGKVGMHTCDQRDCVELTHVLPATQRQNVQDMHDKGRWKFHRELNRLDREFKQAAAC